MQNQFLVSKRIYLRPVEEGDLERCLRWINDPEVITTLGKRFPTNAAMEKEWLDSQYKSENSFSLAIMLKDGDQHIGNCGFNDIDYVNRNAEFGILIGEKDQWGKGYASEAARLLLDYGFEELNLHRIFLEVYAHNKRAQRAYEKAGFVHEGTMRESYFRGGVYHDTLVMAVLRSDWEGGDGASILER
jgi:RimJ/RimL family protein N-acetyltransferase